MSEPVEMRAYIDLYYVIASWIKGLHWDEPGPPIEMLAERLRAELERGQADADDTRALLHAAREVTRYVCDQVLVNAEEVIYRQPTHKAGHA